MFLYHCLYFKLGRVEDGFLYSALVDNFYQCLMVFLRELGGYDNLEDYFCEHYFISSFLIDKTFNERNTFRGYLSLLTEAKDINACTGANGGKKMFEGTRGRTFTSVSYRLISGNDYTIDFRIDFFPTREGNLDLYGFPLLWCMVALPIENFLYPEVFSPPPLKFPLPDAEVHQLLLHG